MFFFSFCDKIRFLTVNPKWEYIYYKHLLRLTCARYSVSWQKKSIPKTDSVLSQWKKYIYRNVHMEHIGKIAASNKSREEIKIGYCFRGWLEDKFCLCVRQCISWGSNILANIWIDKGAKHENQGSQILGKGKTKVNILRLDLFRSPKLVLRGKGNFPSISSLLFLLSN